MQRPAPSPRPALAIARLAALRRVLGYDNSHRSHHRHRMGKVEPVEFTSFEELRRRFEREWMELARRHLRGEI